MQNCTILAAQRQTSKENMVIYLVSVVITTGMLCLCWSKNLPQQTPRAHSAGMQMQSIRHCIVLTARPRFTVMAQRRGTRVDCYTGLAGLLLNMQMVPNFGWSTAIITVRMGPQ